MAMVKGHVFPGGRSVMPKAAGAVVPKSPPPKNGGESLEIRGIDNGYLVEHRTWQEGPRGYKSQSKTTFSPTKPKISY